MSLDEAKLDLNYIYSKIQNILNKTHSLEPKRKLVPYPSESNPDRLNMACPICGDSDKSAHKRRGNLYLSNAMYKCYNCDSYMSFTKLCDTFNETIDMDQRIKLYNYIDTNTKFNNNNVEYISTELDKLIDIDDFMEYFNNKKNSWLIDIMPVQKNSHVYQYLKYGRNLHNFDGILQGTYRVVRDGVVKFSTKVLINVNMGMDKVLGIQLRNLESDPNKRFYKIIEFDEIYNYMNPTDQLDEIEAISYNKLSHFYNILNVNFDEPVTIFEGYLDSKFCMDEKGIVNSIGLVGLGGTDDLLNFLLESDEDLDLQFFYDNDVAGIKKSTEMLKKGHKVFLWNKLFEKLIEKNKNKYDGKEKLKNIKDLNDLVISSKNYKIYNKLKLNNFFSNDEFDILYMDKLKFNRDEMKWEVIKN